LSLIQQNHQPPPKPNQTNYQHQNKTKGKPQAIARIRQRRPYNTIVMVGDGITDLEAVQVRADGWLVLIYRAGPGDGMLIGRNCGLHKPNAT
jgi:phosphoglycolate phosphatase-like HAD superfamily hydrolase